VPDLFLEPSADEESMLTLNSIIQRDPDVIAAEADQDLIMVSIATGSYYGLSDVARGIWDAIEHPKKISDLIDDLTASYQIDSISCEEQTLSFLEALLDEGLLRVEDGSAG
jgi:Coenzyme PQQ synthesis protein D (PqqD)